MSQEEPVAKDASSCPERKMDDLDALLAHLLQCGWESPWTVPAAVDRDLLERLVERNIQRLDLPPGVYGNRDLTRLFFVPLLRLFVSR